MQIVYRDEVLSRKGPTLTANGMALVLDDPRPEGRCLKPLQKRKISLRMEYNRYGNLEQKELYENGKRSLRMKWDRFGKLVEKETY